MKKKAGSAQDQQMQLEGKVKVSGGRFRIKDLGGGV